MISCRPLSLNAYRFRPETSRLISRPSDARSFMRSLTCCVLSYGTFSATCEAKTEGLSIRSISNKTYYPTLLALAPALALNSFVVRWCYDIRLVSSLVPKLLVPPCQYVSHNGGHATTGLLWTVETAGRRSHHAKEPTAPCFTERARER